jgi:hypothetical protein
VARAKRTARAEARRRSRAATDIDEPLDEATPEVARRADSTSATRAGQTPARMGFGAAFRAAIHPVNVRADLASLPWLALHTKALWLPVLITIASTVFIVATNGGDWSLFMFAYFIQTPAIGGVFIAGFLAPRASWLLGAIVGLVAAICYSVLVVAYPATIYTELPPTPDQTRDIVLAALVLSPVFGALLAAGAAWYRRFLRLSSPNRSRQPDRPKGARPGDGRTRAASPSQKAGVKR